jgi:hypothetical protein
MNNAIGRLLTPIGVLTLCLSAQNQFSYSKLATLGDPAPPGAFHINDFETGAINNRGDVIFGTDLATSSTLLGEGVFLLHAGQVVELARSTGSAPGGGTFDVLLMGQAQLNDDGDGAFAFTLSPFDFSASPFGLNAGVYRYSHVSGKVTPVVLPYSTPAPAGGTFAGAGFNVSLTNGGDLAFTGIVPTHAGLGFGIFKQDKQGHITSIVSPGDAAPGGGSFDAAGNAVWINQKGDVAFVAHLTGEENGRSGLYLKAARAGSIISIAHAGDPAPGGGVFRSAYSPIMNDAGDIVFQGDLSASPAFLQVQGVYLYSKGEIIAVARPGDAMPGGGNFASTEVFPNALHINNAGEVVFGASLDTGATGMYRWSKGSVRLIARDGTILPGIGTIKQVVTGGAFVFAPGALANTEVVNNDRGQVFFAATLTDGTGVLLVATPH